MSHQFVDISKDKIFSFLNEKGFVENPNAKGNEIVFERKHHAFPEMIIRVYTSIERNSSGIRGVGEDAIRITAFFEDTNKTIGIYKTKRVNRVGSEEAILDRMLERMREAYQTANKWLFDNKGHRKVSK